MTARARGGYLIRQVFPEMVWPAVVLDWWQAERLRERGERIYQTAAQAWAVARAMNRRREGSESSAAEKEALSAP